MIGPVGVGVDVGVVEVDETRVVEVNDTGVVEVDDTGIVTELVVLIAEEDAFVEAEIVVRVVGVVDVDVAAREYN